MALGALVRMYNYVRPDYERPDCQGSIFERTDMTHTGSCR